MNEPRYIKKEPRSEWYDVKYGMAGHKNWTKLPEATQKGHNCILWT